MYHVKKRIEISAAHRLELPYASKCNSLHGHNWIIHVHCKVEEVDAIGMVVDFSVIKKTIVDALDHRNLNDVFDFNPTAENIARWVVDTIPDCYKATVIESEDNEATYEKI